MQLRSVSTKLDLVEVPARCSPRSMQRLMNVSQEMRHPLQRIRAREIRTTADTLIPIHYPRDAFPQNRRLVRNRTNNTSTLCAVLVIIERASIRRPVMGVYPMPLVRETAFSGVGVGVSPCGGTADGLVVLWLEKVGEDGCGARGEECLGHEADLVVDCTNVR